MKIPDPTTLARLPLERVRSDLLASLRPGRVVQAEVVTPGAGAELTLRIGRARVRARTTLPLAPGERLTLLVARAPRPLELRVLRAEAGAEIRARSLRLALPKQASPARLVDRIRDLTATAGSRPSAAGAVIPRADAVPPAPPGPGRNPGAPPPEASPGPQVGVPRLERPGPPVPAPRPALPAPPSGPPRGIPAGGHPVEPGPPPAPLRPQVGTALWQALARILELTLSKEQATDPVRLRQAVEGSGLWLESRLGRGLSPGDDLKGALLRLLFQLRNHPELARAPAPQAAAGDSPEVPAPAPDALLRLWAELLTRTEGGLARILVNQLNTAAAEEGTETLWQLDLPVMEGERTDNFRLRISRGGRGRGTEGGARWTARLDFDLPPLGPVSSRLILEGDRISTHFTAQRPESVPVLMQALPRLDRALQKAGLKVGQLTARRGAVGEEARSGGPRPPLLDEKA